MVFKYPIFILLFLFFALLQNSFLPYFSIFGTTPNLVFILFFLLVFFEEKNEYAIGFFAIICAGLFLDVFLPSYFGLAMVSLVIIYFLHKLLVHFLREGQDKFPVFYFIPAFSVFFLVYNALLYVFSIIIGFQFYFGVNILAALLYNLVFACVGFYIYKKISLQGAPNNQLKLF